MGDGWRLLGASLSRPDSATLMPARCVNDGSWHRALVGKPSGCVRLSRCGKQSCLVCFGVCVFESRTCRFKRSTRQLTASGDQGRRARSARASTGGRRSPRTRKRAEVTAYKRPGRLCTAPRRSPRPPWGWGAGGWGNPGRAGQKTPTLPTQAHLTRQFGRPFTPALPCPP